MKNTYERYLNTYTRIASGLGIDLNMGIEAPDAIAAYHVKISKAPVSYKRFTDLIKEMVPDEK